LQPTLPRPLPAPAPLARGRTGACTLLTSSAPSLSGLRGCSHRTIHQRREARHVEFRASPGSCYPAGAVERSGAGSAPQARVQVGTTESMHPRLATDTSQASVCYAEGCLISRLE
jgi:hypothetical protein